MTKLGKKTCSDVTQQLNREWRSQSVVDSQHYTIY